METRKKKLIERSGVTVGVASDVRQTGLAKPEPAISEPVEFQQWPIDGEPGRGDQPLALGRGEVELDDRPRDVPGGILATDQIMALVMIERVGLHQPPVVPA